MCWQATNSCRSQEKARGDRPVWVGKPIPRSLDPYGAVANVKPTPCKIINGETVAEPSICSIRFAQTQRPREGASSRGPRFCVLYNVDIFYMMMYNDVLLNM